MNTMESVNADEAARDPQKIFREAGEGEHRFVIVNDGDVPATAVLSMSDLSELQDDLELMSVLLVRAVNAGGKRYGLDDVMARFGYSDADLDMSSESCC
ncbi:MAG: hypothetical protein ACSLE6_06420 [Mycobacterium sp.]